jgi:two-component system cell cycle response regulator
VIAVIAHADPDVCRAASDVLEEAGWELHTATDADGAIAACRETGADVLLAGDGHDEPLGLLDRVKRDTDLFHTAVVLIGHDLGVAEVVQAMERGVDDVVRLPLDPADLVARAFAAARTKALVEELTAHTQRLEELIFFDELTGVRNRRAVLHELEMLVAAARRHDHQLSVLLIDIDRFKAINDTYGHGPGDEVLREVTQRMCARLRKEDVAGRLGGDELIVVVPETGGEGAAVLARSICDAMAATPIPTSAGTLEVTVSVGFATWAGESVPDLLERADRALYSAKAAGRARSVAA